MGLGGMKYAWQRQTKDFAHAKGEQYSSLIIDNRGIGESGKPTSRYSTSEMAKDVIEVIDHIGWTSKRDLHVIGISMGGMIAQEIVSYTNFDESAVYTRHATQCFRSRNPRKLYLPSSTAISGQNAKGIKPSINMDKVLQY
jgi:predicted alpha/beta-fold hydrolase